MSVDDVGSISGGSAVTFADEEAEERMMLARAEANQARNSISAAKNLRHSAPPPTPVEDFGHLPEPVRVSCSKVTDWVIDAETHTRFSHLCSCDKNAEMPKFEKMIKGDTHISFLKYSDAVVKTKSLKQWQARALAIGSPEEAVLATRSKQEALRLMAITFFIKAKPGEHIMGDCKGREHLIDNEVEEWQAS